MKFFFLAAVVTLVSLPLSAGQSRNSGKQGDAEQTLRRIEQELTDALAKGDASAFERYVANTFVYTDAEGTMMDKAQLVSDTRSGALKAPSVKMDDIKVHLYGDTAVVTWRSTEKGTTYKGKDLSGQYRFTDVFVRQNGNWQMVASHGTRISKP